MIENTFYQEGPVVGDNPLTGNPIGSPSLEAPLGGTTRSRGQKLMGVGGGADLSTKLRALGAMFSNKVPEFRQQMMQENQMQNAMEMQSLQRRDVIQQALMKDNLMALNFAKANDYTGLMELLKDRLSMEQNLGLSTESTLEMIADVDRDGIQSIIPHLSSSYAQAIQLGILSPPVGPEYKGRDPDTGDVILQDPISGTVYAESPIGGKQGIRGERAAWEDNRDTIMSTARKFRADASEMVGERGKLESLARQVTDENSDNTSRRRAAATLVTVLARLASPGVVTDRDFANFGGGVDLRSYIEAEAASGGDFSVLKDFMSTRTALPQEILTGIDPTNPENFDYDGIMRIANGLVMSSGQTILDGMASLFAEASGYSQARPEEIKAAFGETSNRNINKLGSMVFGNNWNGVTDFFQNPDIGISNSMQRRPYVDADNYGLQSSNFRGAGLPAQAARAGYSVEQFNALPIHEQRLFTD